VQSELVIVLERVCSGNVQLSESYVQPRIGCKSRDSTAQSVEPRGIPNKLCRFVNSHTMCRHRNNNPGEAWPKWG
jgi:hypothetical protein